MRIALVGQPNCGKSTLFNQVAGYKAATGNYHGTTVAFTESRVRVAGEVVELVDLPGTYTLAGASRAEAETRRYLASHQVDVIVDVADASHLAQGLEMTLELLSLGRPVLLALNMMDEAVRMGLRVDGRGLQEALGIPVLPLIASRGQGVRPLFLAALQAARSGRYALPQPQPVLLEQAAEAPGRHALAARLTEDTVRRGERQLTVRDRLDEVLLHPLWGYAALTAILYVFFQFVYGFGRLLEGPVLAAFDLLSQRLAALAGGQGLWANLLTGLIQGISGGLAIVLPYLVPFLLGLGLMEDVGYLPRIAFLMDGLMHRLGLHGKAILPFILGYGCNVPAVMSTRILEDRRDRALASALAVLVPCSARLAVVFGLVAFYLGPGWALGIYLLNILIIALVGRLLTRFLPEDTPGLILEMPVYRLPTLKTVTAKTWFRVREFIVEAWPLLIAGSVLLGLLNYLDVSAALNWLVRPITWALGLPSEVGVPLILGILRKELSLIMLRQAVGVSDFSAVLTPAQMLTYTVFVVFYIPCLPTLAALRRELGGKAMVAIAALTVVVALACGLAVRLLAATILG